MDYPDPGGGGDAVDVVAQCLVDDQCQDPITRAHAPNCESARRHRARATDAFVDEVASVRNAAPQMGV